MSQASSIFGEGSPTRRASTMPSVYETYLCREPANDVPMLMRNAPDEYTSLLRTLQRSADYFAERDQNRAVERLQLEMARLHMKNQQWDRATRVLVPLWQTLTWRRAGWWQLIEDIDWTLRECASQLKDKETLLAVEWELLNNCKFFLLRMINSSDFSQP